MVAIDKREREQDYHNAAERVLSKTMEKPPKGGFLSFKGVWSNAMELDMVRHQESKKYLSN